MVVEGPPERRTGFSGAIIAQFVALATLWGGSFMFIKIGLEGISVGQVVWARVVFGAVTLLLLSVVTRQRFPRELAVWRKLAVVSVFMTVIPFSLFSWAELHVSSGLASIMNATTPLMTLLVALIALPEERPTRTKLLGLALGFIGVVMVLGPWRDLDGHSSLVGQIACLGATLCYGIGYVTLRRIIRDHDVPSIPLATMQVGFGAIIMLIATPFIASPMHLTARVVISMVILGALSTGIAYVANTNIVHAVGATNASTVTYVTPLVGVVLGILVLHESFVWNQPVGALLVITGIVVGQNRLRRKGRRRTTPESAL